MANDFDTIRAALRNVAPQLHARANVVATGVGYKISGGQRTADLSIVCSVAKKLGAAELSARDLVPATIDGTVTDVVESGRIRALRGKPRAENKGQTVSRERLGDEARLT